MKKIVLIILDGFGLGKGDIGDAIHQSNTPLLDYLYDTYPSTSLHAASLAIGLPEGQIGNSEVGHLHLGSGRIMPQSLVMINQSLKDGTLVNHAAWNTIKNRQTAIHFIGLVSDGGVHSHINHLLALLKIFKNQQNVYVHLILDGRDTKQDQALQFVSQVQQTLQSFNLPDIASISGRYYAMDRDQRWARTMAAYNNLLGKGLIHFDDPILYIKHEYRDGRYDEFVKPAWSPLVAGHIKDGDNIVLFNFRPDRMIQLTTLLTNSEDHQHVKLHNHHVVSLINYADHLQVHDIIFKKPIINNCLSEWLSKKGLTQLRIAETEKYAHVTYFFDGGQDTLWPNVERILIPSLKVATYDLAPAMKAQDITNVFLEKWINYDFTVINFANPDMLGHTGFLKQTMQGIEIIDACLKQIYDNVTNNNGILIITADHGNAEMMINDDHTINPAHTINQVPFIINQPKLRLKSNLTIASVSPTILALLNIHQPPEMDQPSLIINESD